MTNYDLMISINFLYYLWGIETNIVIDKLTIDNALFILPMRNWNTMVNEKKNVLRLAFYITYEELKHDGKRKKECTKISFLYYLWGIETRHGQDKNVHIIAFYITYEELKLLWVLRWKYIDKNTFYITYEELKLCCYIYINIDLSLFILPMRNWN